MSCVRLGPEDMDLRFESWGRTWICLGPIWIRQPKGFVSIGLAWILNLNPIVVGSSKLGPAGSGGTDSNKLYL